MSKTTVTVRADFDDEVKARAWGREHVGEGRAVAVYYRKNAHVTREDEAGMKVGLINEVDNPDMRRPLT